MFHDFDDSSSNDLIKTQQTQEIMASSATTNYQGIWPEDDPERKGYLQSLSDHLLYSYMGAILKKGSELHRQRSKTGTQSQQKQDSTSEDASNHDGKNAAEFQSTLLEQELSNEDLFEAPKTMHSDYLIEKFRSAYRKYNSEMEDIKLNVNNSDSDTPTGMDIDITTKEKVQKQKSLRIARSRVLMKVLWILAKPTYLPAGLFQLVTVIVQTLCPLVVQHLLIQFEQHEHESILSIQGLLFAILLFLCSIIDGIAQERHRFLAFQAGITLRAAAVNAIYDQMLNLSAKGKESLSTGETTNLVAIECQKLFEVTQEGHLIWSCPLSMIIVTILLLVTLGKSTLVGMASMILFVPLVKKVVSRMMTIRKKRAVFTDRRIGKCS